MMTTAKGKINSKNSAKNIVGLISLIAVFIFFGLNVKIASASGLVKPPNNLGLVGYWSFEDATGTKATDFSGSKNTATLQGSAWIGGKMGKGLSFNGSSDYVLGNSPVTITGYPFTLSAWIKIGSLQNGTILSLVDNTDSFARKYYNINVTSAGFAAITARNTTDRTNVGSISIASGWHHVVGVFNSSTDRNLYVDGVFEVNGSVSSTFLATIDKTMIGVKELVVGSNYFNGVIDDARIYNRALSPTEVTALYNSGGIAKANSSLNNFMASGLVGLWSFDGMDVNGTTVYDRSNNGNNGAMTNSPSLVRGKVGQGIQFNGGTNFVQIPDSNSLDVTNKFSIAFWMKPNATLNSSTGRQDIVVKFLSYWVILNYPSNDGKISFTVNAGSPTVQTTTSSWSMNTWYYIAATYDGADFRIYVDGVLENTAAGSNADSTANVLTLGASPTTPSYSNTTLDDLRIYNRTLSPAEVTQLYRGGSVKQNSSQVGVSDGLIFWHTFDGSKLNTATSTDSSASGSNGSLSGGPFPIRGRLGQGLQFDGADDYVDVGSPAALQLQAFSASFWYKGSETPGNNDTFLSYARHDGSAENGWSLRIDEVGNPGKIWLDISDSPAGMTNFSSINDGNWHHVAIANHAVDDHRIYIDGAIDVLNTTTVSSINYTSAKFYIGARLGSFGTITGYMPGTIDDVRIYSRPLSAVEIKQLYNMGK